MMEILAPVVNFLVVLFIVVYFGRKPLKDFLISRSDTIANQMKEAESRAEQSKRDLAEWETKWKQAQNEAATQLNEAKTAFARQREETLAFAQKEAERIKKEAKMTASNEAQKIADEVQLELVTRSIGMVNDYFEHKLEAAPKEKLVNEFVELVNGSAR